MRTKTPLAGLLVLLLAAACGDPATTARADQRPNDPWGRDFLSTAVSEGRPKMQLPGPELTLSGDSTEIRLQDREVADPDPALASERPGSRPLRGTRWVVDTVIDGQAASSVPEGADANVTFGDDDAFGGSTGCNQMGGTAVVDEAAGTAAFSDVFATMIACEDDKMALEEAVLSVLDGQVTYTLKADRLTLSHPSGKGLGLRAAR